MHYILPSSSKSRCHLSVLTALATSMLLMQANIAHAADGNGVTTINNIAQVSYNVDNSAQKGTSNKVSFESFAKPKYAITLSEKPLQTVDPATTAEWVNVLTNTGTYDATVILDYSYLTSFSNFRVYRDLDSDGEFDEGEQLPNLSQIKINQGESIELIVQALNAELTGDNPDGIKIGATVVEDTSVIAATTDRLLVVAPGIKFTNAGFTENKNATQVGNDVFVETGYAQCNFNPNSKDEVWVTIQSSNPPIGSGDTYSLKAIETGSNTGKYQIFAPTQNNANAINDSIIQTLKGDTLTATLDACIDPNGNRVEIGSVISSNIAIVDDNPTLVVTKESEVKSAELGDYVNYTISVKNDGKATAYDVELKDALPRGFDYVKGSVRIDKEQTTEFKTDGKYQVLSLGDMDAKTSKEITYRVLVGASALGGDGINRATAHGNDKAGDAGNTLVSREAQWKIEVERGVMNTDGIIVGKVYHDINRDGIQQKEDGELGVAGVRIYMENGNFIVTDPEGKYNFYGVSAKTHVLKVDRTTIPNATELVIQSNRNAGDASSRFVDLKYGELHRADFGIVGGMGDSTERLNAELVARSKCSQ